MQTNRRWLGCLTFLLAVGLPSASTAQTEVERTVAAQADGTVKIENISGSVVVTGWDRDQVEITGTLGRDVEELQVDTSGGGVAIRVELPRRSHGGGTSAHLAVKVPRHSDLEVETVSAEITVEDVDGDLETESVSGSVRIDGRPRTVDVETVSGNVEIGAEAAEISVESVSGQVQIRGAAGRLEVESVSGRVEVTGENLLRADIESVSGTIDVDVSLAAGGDLDVSSHSGTIELRLPASTSARFEVTTFSGRIDNELGPPARKVSRYTPQKELEFTLGGGDGRINVESFSANVKLMAR
ncbi:MAG: DUF4097 family beta strand repeat-containing protein [Thermoanaerobaculia bacterium]